MIIGLLTRTAKELLGEWPLSDEDRLLAAKDLPAPMLPNNWDRINEGLIAGPDLSRPLDESETRVRHPSVLRTLPSIYPHLRDRTS
jgi:hypothetical protein